MARQDELTTPGNPGDYWKLLAARPVPVPVVAAEDEIGPAGFLALSVSHVSADPPSMMVAIGKSTSALATILRARHFSINYLPDDAAETADVFGGRRKIEGRERFEAGRWMSLTTGAPIFGGAVLALDCSLERSFEYHQTTIAVGLIMAWSIDREQAALLSYGGAYTGLFSTSK